MAITGNRLTAIKVAKATRPGLLADGHGLYLRIKPTGAKSWVFRYRRDGKLHDMGLGPVHIITLAEARAKALELRRQRFDGTDPLAAKREAATKARIGAAKGMTFQACAEAYIAAHRAGWKNAKHAWQWPSTLEAYVYPIFGALPVQAVDVGLVMKAIQPIWTAKPETASRVRGRIESILDWATASGHRQAENPARWRGHLENLLPKKSKVRRVAHHAALPYVELPAFMGQLRQQQSFSARALEFTILTAARTGEVIGATWTEIDFEGRLWTIPGGRMKAGREHRVPLSDAALAILRPLAEARTGEYVFPSLRDDRPLSQTVMLMLLRRMGRGDLTVHGFRSAFSDWTAEQTGTPSEVREMALAHTVSDKVEAAYRRGDLFEKRRALMDVWARYCAEPQSGRGGTVVAISTAR
jgi:integrase